MVRYNYNKEYNSGHEYNELEKMTQPAFYDEYLKGNPVLLDQDKRVLAILENADLVINNREKKATDELEFVMPYNDPKVDLIKNERIIRIIDADYLIRNIKPSEAAGKMELEIKCERDWYDLKKGKKMAETKWEGVKAKIIMADILADIDDWKPGNIEVNKETTMEVDENLSNRLKALRELEDQTEGVLYFNSSTGEIDLLEDQTQEIGVAIIKGKNMNEIEVEYDTKDLTTRLYPYGRDFMTIEDAADGAHFVENYQYTDKILVESFKDERFTNPYSLKDRAEGILKKLSKPRMSFKIGMTDLSQLTGLSHEQLIFGGIVRVYHADLQIEDKVEIVKWDRNMRDPSDTTLELSSKKETLSDLLADVDADQENLQSEQSVTKQDILDLMVFNYLQNSRADSDMEYWTNNGWEVDPNNGYSSSASFYCEGQKGKEKTLEQTIHPANRDNFSLSLRTSTQDIDLGNNGKIGVEIEVFYDDGESEIVFLPLVE